MLSIDVVMQAVEQVESNGKWWVESAQGCVGVMQICPRWSKRTRAELLHPDINRAEGRRMLEYWLTKAHQNWHTALAGYNCGWRGLRRQCGGAYARKVLRVAKHLQRASES